MMDKKNIIINKMNKLFYKYYGLLNIETCNDSLEIRYKYEVSKHFSDNDIFGKYSSLQYSLLFKPSSLETSDDYFKNMLKNINLVDKELLKFKTK